MRIQWWVRQARNPSRTPTPSHLVTPASPLPRRSVRCWAVAAGLVMFLSELLLAGSLLTFQAPAAVHAIKAAAMDMTPGRLARMGLRERLLDLLVISILYIPVSRTALRRGRWPCALCRVSLPNAWMAAGGSDPVSGSLQVSRLCTRA